MSDQDNPDFIACAECGGEFYKGDLDSEGVCEDCREAMEAALDEGDA